MQLPDAPSEKTPRIKAALVALVLALAALVSFTGSGDDLPLDTHDVMVALTTQEMMQRNKYLVPYINDEPRLKKPPLSYWAVAGLNHLHGGDQRVTPSEARRPSALAGVLLAGATLALGVVLVGWEVALIGTLFLISSRGFTGFTHSSRPEMLYAAWCAWALVGFALSDRWERTANTQRRAQIAAYAAWLMLGLASLTKGPHLPFVILVAQVVGLVATGEKSRILRVMRPLVGFAIMAGVSLWWALLVLKNVPDARSIWMGEVQGRTGGGNDPFYRYFYPYYLYSPAVLLLPWVAFLPLLWAGPWLRKIAPLAPAVSTDADERPRFIKLWCLVAVTALLLNCVWGRREYYLLPVLPAIMLVVAYGALWLGNVLKANKLDIVWRAAMIILALGSGGLVVFFWRTGDPDHRPGSLAVLIAIVIAIASAVIGQVAHRKGRSALPAAAVAWALCMSIASSSGANWGSNRFERDAFAQAIKSDLPDKSQLFGWKEQWYIEVYRTGRIIPVLKDLESLEEQVRNHGTVYVLLRPKKRPIPASQNFAVTSVRKHDSRTSSDDEGGSDPLELIRVDAKPPI